MATPYSDLYYAALAKIKDYGLATLDESEVFAILYDYIRPAVVSFHTCKKDLSDRSETSEQFTETLDDTEIDILANYMALAYLEANYINTPMALSQDLTNNEFKSLFKGTLGQLIEFRDSTSSRIDTLLSRYSWRASS